MPAAVERQPRAGRGGVVCVGRGGRVGMAAGQTVDGPGLTGQDAATRRRGRRLVDVGGERRRAAATVAGERERTGGRADLLGAQGPQTGNRGLPPPPLKELAQVRRGLCAMGQG